MASYGCLHEWAGLLGNEEAAELLQQILDEEKAANDSLTELARESCNQQALGDSDENESDDADENPAQKQSAASRKRSAVLAK